MNCCFLREVIMKNILSYGCYKKFKGKDIKEWISYHVTNKTSYTKIALKMGKYLNIADEEYYFIKRGDYQAGKRNFCIIKCE